MPRLGLALSGGGFRATLFHLGVVRFLRDAGLLGEVSHIVSVSGGSILAAHLALNWDQYNGSPADFDEAASKIIQFVRLDVRNRIVRRLPMCWPIQLLQRFTFQGQSRRFTANGLLQGYYEKYLYGNNTIHDLPETPQLHILATNVSEGSLCSFNRTGLTMQRRGAQQGVENLPAYLARISMAVSASSAFPGFFPPVRVTAAEIGLQEGQFPSQAFTDGGVYDNLGVRAFDWWKDMDPPFDEILVSDTGQIFRILPKKPLGMVGQAVRASDILWDRVWQLEKLNFRTDPRFLFVPSTDVVDIKEDPTALDPVIQPEVQNIRTDLDRFSPIEIRALVGHGYCVARKQCRSRPDIFGTDLPSSPPWDPTAPTQTSTEETTAEAKAPTGASVSATEQAHHIRRSADRRIWSTLLDFRDWPTYVYIPLLILLFVVLPYFWYRSYRQARMNELVIDAIASGDPEFRKILELVREKPPVDFPTTTVKRRSKPPELTFTGLEMMETTRIIDLRRWNPKSPTLYVYSRTRLRKKPDYTGDNKVRFLVPVIQGKDPAIRLRPKILDPVLFQIEDTEVKIKRTDLFAGTFDLCQAEFDLTELTIGEVIDLTLEGIWHLPEYEGTTAYSFNLMADTAVTNVWILFPEDKPYRKYQLLRYEPVKPAKNKDQPQQPPTLDEPKVVKPRYSIDHPYGFIIGWSMINARKDEVYKCEWEWKE